jgi:hypothetical protein
VPTVACGVAGNRSASGVAITTSTVEIILTHDVYETKTATIQNTFSRYNLACGNFYPDGRWEAAHCRPPSGEIVAPQSLHATRS